MGDIADWMYEQAIDQMNEDNYYKTEKRRRMSENMKDANGYDIIPNTFKLFENSKKEKDSQPDYTGKAYDENGREIFISAWVNETKKGTQYISGKMVDAEEARAKWGKDKPNNNKKINHEGVVTSSGTELDDDLPF